MKDDSVSSSVSLGWLLRREAPECNSPDCRLDSICSLNRLANDCLQPSFSAIILSMPETSIQTPPGFNQLPKAEQVRYLQALWDQISANPDEVPVPESHLQLAEERLRRYREDPSTAKPAFEVIDRLTRKSK